jgi:hypothetical protein
MKSTTDWAKQIQTELKSLNRLHQYQVSRYQVFELPRSTADPKDGQVQMILHGGMASFGPWHKADEIIEAWQRAIRD